MATKTDMLKVLKRKRDRALTVLQSNLRAETEAIEDFSYRLVRQAQEELRKSAEERGEKIADKLGIKFDSSDLKYSFEGCFSDPEGRKLERSEAAALRTHIDYARRVVRIAFEDAEEAILLEGASADFKMILSSFEAALGEVGA